jgi:hypothetical protein
LSSQRKPDRNDSELVSRRKVIGQLVALPAAFSIVPLRLEGRATPHEHVVGMAAQHPCPNTWTFVGEMTVNGRRMCAYQDPEGGLHAVECPV